MLSSSLSTSDDVSRNQTLPGKAQKWAEDGMIVLNTLFHFDTSYKQEFFLAACLALRPLCYFDKPSWHKMTVTVNMARNDQEMQQQSRACQRKTSTRNKDCRSGPW
jgi:hypothetical protein